MTLAQQIDGLTVGDLRAAGSIKWTRHPDAIGAFIAETDFPVAEPIKVALHDWLDGGAFGYLPEQLAERSAVACAQWHQGRYGWSIDPAEIRVLPDVLKGLQLALRHYTPTDAAIIVPTPAYMPFLTEPVKLGYRVIEVPLARDDGRWSLDLDALTAAFRDGGHTLLLCNPHNPTGRSYTREELLGIAAVVEAAGGRVFSDEIHGPILYGDRKHTPYASLHPSAAEHSMTATSASKAWNLPGLKCAQLLLTNPRDREIFDGLGMADVHGASTPGVIASIAAFEEGGEWLGEAVDYLHDGRRLLAESLATQLPEIVFDVPDATYLAWLDVRALHLGPLPASRLLELARVAMVDGSLCGSNGHGFVRFNFAMPHSLIERAVTQLAEAIRSLPSRQSHLQREKR